MEQGTGLSADSLEIVGALTSGRLAESELARGLFDGAAVAVWRVDWANPDDRVLVLSGTVGEVSRGPTAFTAEVRGLADRLNQPRGRVYQRSCDALLGDARCGIDAAAAAIRGAGTVATVRSARSVTASGLSGYVSRWFEAGRLVWTSGANAGAAVEVRAHGLSGGLASLDLWEPMPAPISPGDTFQVVAGCDKSLASCRDKFANVLNFRGFPDLPGNDYAVAYAVQGADNDGGRLG